jgi:hypothetical protein
MSDEIYVDVCKIDRLCGIVVRVPGYRSRDPGSIPGTTRFSERITEELFQGNIGSSLGNRN